jgi:hypothetical protein
MLMSDDEKCIVCLKRKVWQRRMNATCGKDKCLGVWRRIVDRILKA